MTHRLDFLGPLFEDSGSAERARESEAAIGPVDPSGPYVVAFEDSDRVHEVVLYHDGGDWHGSCYPLDEDGQRIALNHTDERHEECKGLRFSDGPCAHLYAVFQAARDDERGDVSPRDAEQERADHHVEKRLADGGRR